MEHSELRQVKFWGSYGKNGDEPLTEHLIMNLSNEHLDNIIPFIMNRQHFYTDKTIKLMLNEQIYRQENNIYVFPYLKDFKFLTK